MSRSEYQNKTGYSEKTVGEPRTLSSSKGDASTGSATVYPPLLWYTQQDGRSLELLSPQVPHPPVGASAAQQRIVAAALDNPASLEHQDLIDTL
jgi:hypothetical protein